MESADHSDPSATHLIDISGLPLDRIVSADDSALLNSLRRVLADIDRPQDVFAAFDNYADQPGNDQPPCS